MRFYLQLNPQVEIAKPPRTLMGTLIDQVRLADRVGFDGFSMGEHYNIPGLQRVHQVPALARLCAETQRCEVGTAVSLIGLRHPVTLASELATLDIINEGRSFFSFGLGYRQQELEAFGLTTEERFTRFIEGIEIVRRLWTEDNVSYEGSAFRLRDVTVDPKPLQKPRPPIWIAANSDRAVSRAAEIADGWLIGPHSAIPELRRQVALCRASWTQAGKIGEPALPIIRETFVAATRAEATAKARPCLDELYRNVYVRWRQNEAMSNPDELRWDFDDLARDRFIIGTPSDAIGQIRRYQDELGTNLLFVRFDWTPGLGQDDVLGAMQLFGDEVIPRL